MESVAPSLSSRTIACGTLRARQLEGAPWVLELTGEADIATLGLLRRELAQVVETHREDVVIDVSRLSFCDVASAHLILTARRRTGATVVGATGSVKRVFDLLDALQRQRLSSYCSLTHPG